MRDSFQMLGMWLQMDLKFIPLLVYLSANLSGFYQRIYTDYAVVEKPQYGAWHSVRHNSSKVRKIE